METILIAGGSGLVGSQLVEMVNTSKYHLKILTRNNDLVRRGSHYLYWNPQQAEISDESFESDYIINLAGAGIADKRWTSSRKKVLIDSRVQSTDFLIRSFSERGNSVRAYIGASAIGFYGDGGESWLTEDMKPVTDEFLSEVCIKWERITNDAHKIADRVVIFRIGTVLSRKGGALAKLDRTISMGVANTLGDGKQFMSWIHEKDLCKMLLYAIERDNVNGIYNAVAPEVVNNRQFTDLLKKVIQPRAISLPAPKMALQLMLGEMSRLLLNSSRVSSEKMIKAGFEFEFPDLLPALEDLYKT